MVLFVWWLIVLEWRFGYCFLFFSFIVFLFARVGHIGPPLDVLSMMERRPLESCGVAAPLPCRMANAGLYDYKKYIYIYIYVLTEYCILH